MSYTKVTTRKKKKSPSQSSAAAASQIYDSANPPSPPSKGKNPEPLMIFFHLNNKYIFILRSRYPRRPIWRRRRFPEHTPSHIINHSGIHSANNQNSSMTLNLVIIFFLISSGAAFTSNSQEIQDRLSTDTGIILELAYKYILHISNNHPLAC